MSLAERKKKVRITSDPNNKAWSEDTNNFGRKMLEKMGWKLGEGLGTNKDGITEHLKVASKDNLLGIGASQKDVESGWLNNSKSYQEILDRLAAKAGDRKRNKMEKKKKSKKDTNLIDSKVIKPKDDLSMPSKTIAVNPRAHRAKFIKNKLVSTYSEAQLQEILGGIN